MAAAQIARILTLSTAHLSPDSKAQLDAWAEPMDHALGNVSACPTLFGITDYGWLIYVTETTEDFPPDLAACLEYARTEK